VLFKVVIINLGDIFGPLSNELFESPPNGKELCICAETYLSIIIIRGVTIKFPDFRHICSIE
jgi:hypothetical protein